MHLLSSDEREEKGLIDNCIGCIRQLAHYQLNDTQLALYAALVLMTPGMASLPVSRA